MAKALATVIIHGPGLANAMGPEEISTLAADHTFAANGMDTVTISRGEKNHVSELPSTSSSGRRIAVTVADPDFQGEIVNRLVEGKSLAPELSPVAPPRGFFNTLPLQSGLIVEQLDLAEIKLEKPLLRVAVLAEYGRKNWASGKPPSAAPAAHELRPVDQIRDQHLTTLLNHHRIVLHSVENGSANRRQTDLEVDALVHRLTDLAITVGAPRTITGGYAPSHAEEAVLVADVIERSISTAKTPGARQTVQAWSGLMPVKLLIDTEHRELNAFAQVLYNASGRYTFETPAVAIAREFSGVGITHDVAGPDGLGLPSIASHHATPSHSGSLGY